MVTGLGLTGGATPMQIANDQAAVASGDWSALLKDSNADASASDGDASLRRTAGDIHSMAANLLLVLAVLHVAGVVVEGRTLRRNLVAPMVLGQNTRRK